MHVCLIAEEYPERLGYLFITENKKSIAADVDGYYRESASSIKANFGPKFKALIAKFNNPESFDKLSSAGAKVEKATVKMQDNLKDAMENQQDLDVRKSLLSCILIQIAIEHKD